MWSFAGDSSHTADSVLDDTAAVGQKNIPVAVTTGFSAGDVCYLYKANRDDEFELIVIASVDSGVKLVAADNLSYSYESSDQIRHYDYWPSAVSTDAKFAPIWMWHQNGVAYYKHTFNFVQDRLTYFLVTEAGDYLLTEDDKFLVVE